MKNGVTLFPPDTPTERKWTGRDELGHHVGRIPWEPSTITMALSWKREKGSKPFLVGCYRIDLACLCKLGYARYDQHDQVLLRFQRTNGNIEIAVNRREPALKIGKNPLARSMDRQFNSNMELVEKREEPPDGKIRNWKDISKILRAEKMV